MKDFLLIEEREAGNSESETNSYCYRLSCIDSVKRLNTRVIISSNDCDADTFYFFSETEAELFLRAVLDVLAKNETCQEIDDFIFNRRGSLLDLTFYNDDEDRECNPIRIVFKKKPFYESLIEMRRDVIKE